MLAFDAFPRFLQSPEGNKVVKSIQSSGGGGGDATLAKQLASAGSQLPQDADEWLNSFVTVAETTAGSKEWARHRVYR